MKSAFFAVCILLSALIAGCEGGTAWHTTSIQHHLPDLFVSGTSDKGTPIQPDELRGKVVLLYFGFTHCAEDCPIVMARLAHLTSLLGNDGGDLRVVFVSLDPTRDNPATLHGYLASFDGAHAIGITASIKVTEALARRYRIAFYRDQQASLPADLPHSNAVYAFDRNGAARLLITPADSDEAVLLDLKRLLDSKTAS